MKTILKLILNDVKFLSESPKCTLELLRDPPVCDTDVFMVQRVLGQTELSVICLFPGAAASGRRRPPAVCVRWRQSRRHSEERRRGERQAAATSGLASVYFEFSHLI